MRARPSAVVFALAVLGVAAGAPMRAAAQAAAPTAAAESAAPEAAQAPAAAPTAAPNAAAAPAVPPVLLVPMPAERLAPPLVASVRDGVLEALRPMVRRREVIAVTDEAALATARACRDAACLGGIVASANAIAGVVVRIERARPRDPVTVVIGVIDPVSGNPRGEPVQGTLAVTADVVAAADVAALVAPLADRMPGPPVRSTLLVAVNVDGATIDVDGTALGRSPVAPADVAPGAHVVTITRPGFLVQRRQLEVSAGQAARLDVDLEATEAQAAEDSAAASAYVFADEGGGGAGSGLLGEWWFWAAVGGGAVLVAVLTGVIIAVATAEKDAVPAGIPVPPLVQP